jgi:hypothetical protein
MAGAIPQGAAQGRIGFREGNEGVQLPHLLEKLLQLGFGHDQTKGSLQILDHPPAAEPHAGEPHGFLAFHPPAETKQERVG